jgi:hypothetical protein
MTLKILLFCMSLALGSAMAQTNSSALFNTTWKIKLDKNSAHALTCTDGKPHVAENGMLVIPQCYTWDNYFKIISITNNNLLLERYDYINKQLTPSSELYYLEKASLSSNNFEKLASNQKILYLRIEG